MVDHQEPSPVIPPGPPAGQQPSLGPPPPPPPPPAVPMPFLMGAAPEKRTFLSRLKDAMVLMTFVGSVLLNVLLLVVFSATQISGEFHEKTILPGDDQRRLAVIEVKGVITDKLAEELRPQFEHVRTQDRYKGLLLHVDSPGGGVTASDNIAHYVQTIRQAGKPVVAFMGGLAASGGYYVSAGADYIMAGATTITGSIGVLAQLPNVCGTLEKIGAQVVVITSTPATKKTIGSPFLPWDPANRDYFLKILDTVHTRFVDVIYAGRASHFQDRSVLEKLADGKVLTSAQAKAAGLIDQDDAYFEQAVDELAKRAGLTRPKVVRLSKVASLREILGGGSQGQGSLINIDASLVDELAKPRLLYLWQGQ